MTTTTEQRHALRMLTNATAMLDGELAELISRATHAREALREGNSLPFGPSSSSGLLGRSATDVEHVAGQVRTLVEVTMMLGLPSEAIVEAYRRGDAR